MIIGISGAQSVGKTTLIEALEKKLGSKFIFKKEITRELKTRGFKINREGDDSTQIAIMNEHIHRLEIDTDVILDRSILDGYVYTQYLHEIDQVLSDTVTKAKILFANNIHKNDILFYIKPEFDIVNDGVRDIDLEFRNRIVELFDKYIKEYNLPVIVLTGSVEERVNQFLDSIKEYQLDLSDSDNLDSIEPNII